MKRKLYGLIIILFIGFQCISQEFESKIETKQIIDNRSFYLNGGLNSQFGGKSRTQIAIDLPPNTNKWYYSVSTSKGKSGTKNLNLAIQLSALMSDPSGYSSSIVSELDVPRGEANVDVYLLDYKNMNKFIQKQDLEGGTFSYTIEGTTENTKQAVVEINDIVTGRVYLGIRNPSTMNGLNISIEVVAITETKSVIEKTKVQKKAELYGALGWTEFENGNYEKCIEYCDKSLEEYRYGWVMANKSLSLLVSGKESEGIDLYVEAITLVKEQSQSNFILKEMIKDLEHAMKLNPEINGAEEIIQLIKSQI